MDDAVTIEKYNKFIKELLHGERWEIRAEAARNIGLIADGRATNILIKALEREDEDYTVINRIIEAMGRIKDVKATKFIINFLKTELEKEILDKKRLFIIIESLMKIGDKRALTHLGILHGSCEEDDIRSLTEEALNCIDPNWMANIKKT